MLARGVLAAALEETLHVHALDIVFQEIQSLDEHKRSLVNLLARVH